MSKTDNLFVERIGRVLKVTLNRPEKRNALDRPLRVALQRAFDEFDQDDELRCAVLTGNGAAFCAGGDLKEMADTKMEVPADDSVKLIGSAGRVGKPVIAAVNGYAFAGGFMLAQDCDLAIASDQAVFGIAEAKRGRGSPWAAPLISMIPRRIMAELLFTAEPIPAQRAYEVGLVNRVVPGEHLVETAMEMANVIADNAPLSVEAAKEMIFYSTNLGRSDARKVADHIYRRVYTSQDAQEGPLAFREKREPNWSRK